MRKLLVLIILTLHSSLILFAQTVNEIEAMCNTAMLSVKLDDFSTTMQQYDRIIRSIESQITPDEIIPPYKIPKELPEYVINGLANQHKDLLEEYVVDILNIYVEIAYNGVSIENIEEISAHIEYLLSFLTTNSQIHIIWSLGTTLTNNNFIDLVIPFYSKQIKRNQELDNQYVVECLELLCSDHAQQYKYYDDFRVFSSKVFNEVIQGGGEAKFTSKNFYLGHLIKLLEHLYYVNEEYATESNIARCIEKINNLITSSSNEIDRLLLSTTYITLANISCNTNQIEKAEFYINKSMDILNPSDLDHYIVAHLIKAQIELFKHNIPEAKKIFEQVYEYRTLNNDYVETSYILHNLRQCAILSHNVDDTYKYTKLYYEHCLKDYLSCSWSMKKMDRMYLWFDYAGSRLYYSLNQVSATSFWSDSLASYTYDIALVQKGFLNKYDSIMRENVNSSNDTELISAYNSYTSAVAQNLETVSFYEDKLQQCYLHHPEFIESFKYDTWKDIQANLKHNEVAIEFAEVYPYLDSLIYQDKDAYYIALLLKNQGTPVPIRICDSKKIEDYVHKSHFLYKYPLCSKAYSDIWGKIEPFLNGIETIYFSPHSLLSNINLEVLSNENKEEFCKKYKVKRLSSTSELAETSIKYTNYNTAALFGGLVYDKDNNSIKNTVKSKTLRKISRSGWKYLEGTLKEVENISKILSRKINVTTYSGNAGTEKEFKNLSFNNPEILHVASHGFYLTEEEVTKIPYYSTRNQENLDYTPAMKRSGLLLAGGQDAWLGNCTTLDNDGILTAEEISGMYLENTKLVVLSACQTGLGLTTTEGVIGLQKAFKLAGVQTIIMSLWEVSDKATKILMTDFYKQINKGKSCRDAFDHAIESVKEWNDNPYYWAAFIMLD